jgi:hypothetical protein
MRIYHVTKDSFRYAAALLASQFEALEDRQILSAIAFGNLPKELPPATRLISSQKLLE